MKIEAELGGNMSKSRILYSKLVEQSFLLDLVPISYQFWAKNTNKFGKKQLLHEFPDHVMAGTVSGPSKEMFSVMSTYICDL